MKPIDIVCSNCNFTQEIEWEEFYNGEIMDCPKCNKGQMKRLYGLGGIKIEDGTRYIDVMRDKEPRKEKRE